MIEIEFFLKILRFGLVGILGMTIDFGVTYTFKERLRFHKYISNSAGFILAATSNYILNRYWTFKSNSPDMVTQFSRFLIISLLGLALNNLIIFLLTDSRLRLNFYVGKSAAIFVVFFWNFFMNYIFTF